MPIIRAQVSIPALTTVTEDSATNSWHFTTTGTGEAILDAITTGLATFYETLDGIKSDNYAWNLARIKYYNLEDATPRVPLLDDSLGLTTAPSSSPLPPELAVCLSYHGAYVSGASQARRRGRVYLGPLNTGVLDTSTGQVLSALTTSICVGAGAFLDTSDAASDWAWVVYSPSGGASYPVIGGWVDNAPDIQRRRGLRPTVRNTFSSL